MSMLDTRWNRFRRFVGPVTRKVPYGHVLSESATYARLLAPRALKPSQRFLIFAQGRSGSTLLADLLNSHPRIFCADEPLTWPRRHPQRYALACSVGHRGDVYGFKVKVYQLTDSQEVDPGHFLRSMSRDGWRCIYLRRRNVLRQALSSMVAEQRRIYHQFDDGRPAPLHLDPGTLIARADARSDYLEAESQALVGVPHLPLVYEEDLLDPSRHQPTASRVFAFLGLDDVQVATRLRKIAGTRLGDVVANVDEIRAEVASSPHAGLLDED